MHLGEFCSPQLHGLGWGLGRSQQQAGVRIPDPCLAEFCLEKFLFLNLTLTQGESLAQYLTQNNDTSVTITIIFIDFLAELEDEVFWTVVV